MYNIVKLFFYILSVSHYHYSFFLFACFTTMSTGDVPQCGDFVYVDTFKWNHEICSSTRIGLVKFVGDIDSPSDDIIILQQIVGIELLQPIADGHDGCIGHKRYFECKPLHGIHLPISSGIFRVSPEDLMSRLQDIVSNLKLSEQQSLPHSVHSPSTSEQTPDPEPNIVVEQYQKLKLIDIESNDSSLIQNEEVFISIHSTHDTVITMNNAQSFLALSTHRPLTRRRP